MSQCPLKWISPNAPSKGYVLGTVLLLVLSGHQRYAHINALRCDGVLGMSKVVSEDSVGRGLSKVGEAAGAQ